MQEANPHFFRRGKGRLLGAREAANLQSMRKTGFSKVCLDCHQKLAMCGMRNCKWECSWGAQHPACLECGRSKCRDHNVDHGD